MSNFVIVRRDKKLEAYEALRLNDRLGSDSSWAFNIYGPQKTFSLISKDNDWICSIGYCCSPQMTSMDSTLKKVLLSFDEDRISALKKELAGQFILIIRKTDYLYIFSDFLGSRNIFYSADGTIISSSFSFIEKSIGINPDDLDPYKFIEFLAVKELLYPCWLGRQTINKNIHYLLPYEYIKIDLNNIKYDIKEIDHYINNVKQSDIQFLSRALINSLDSIINRQEFKNSLVCSSITGGRDSRIVATIAAKRYASCHYRIAISSLNRNSLKNFKIAKKISKINETPLDIYELELPYHENIFTKITENFCPAFNITITPVIINSGRYAIGFGGVYGTELFVPIAHKSIQEYLAKALLRAKSYLTVGEYFWERFVSSIQQQIKEIKEHYIFERKEERDYLRLFYLLITARYSSFIVSAFNQFGYQLEPFGSFPLIELAFQISPELWGNKRRIAGDALVEAAALSGLSPRTARVLPYSSYRPMMPFSILSSPLYMWGYALKARSWLINKIIPAQKKQFRRVMPGVFYVSNGWERYYMKKLSEYSSH